MAIVRIDPPGESLSPDQEVPTCGQGHPLTPENVVFINSGTNGKAYPRCRECRRQSVQRVRQRQQGEDIPLQQRFTFPRKPCREVEPQPDSTVTLFGQLDPSLRTRIAGVVMGAKAPPITLCIIRKATEQRVHPSLTGNAATVALVDYLIEQSVDARSPDLRLSVLLAVVFGD